MKKSLITALVSLFAVYAFAQDETRTPGSFKGVSVSGSYKVTLVKGSKEKVEIDFKYNTESDDIITEVSGGILKIKTRNGVRNADADITVTFREIESVYSSGSSYIELKDALEGENMEIQCSGSGDIRGKVKGEDLKIKISGSANVELTGSAREIDFTSSGSGNLDAYGVEAEEVEVSISGSSKAKVYASKSLEVSISGSGDVYYKGSPDIERMRVSGSGSVRKG